MSNVRLSWAGEWDEAGVMGETTGIEWTDATWNPWHGCHKISPGCKNCYMFSDKARYGQNPDIVVRSKTQFDVPLKWKEPRRIFTCSWSDWLIEEADPWRDEAYEIIRRTPHHTYQILTKRINRAEGRIPIPPLPNVWLGVSVESRATKDRIDRLRDTPAALRFLSIEPLLEDVGVLNLDGIDWVICGGESGPGARPMRSEWARDVRDQCIDAGVAFFFKQWGEYGPSYYRSAYAPVSSREPRSAYPWGGGVYSPRVGKKAAGHLLDGKEWRQFPEARL